MKPNTNLTLADLRNSPAVPYEEDEVTRIIQDDVNEKILYGNFMKLFDLHDVEETAEGG